MRKIIANQQRQRSLTIWHDHSTILNNGLIMITVHVIYDKAVFLTNEEYNCKTGKHTNVQCQVEQPEIYMLVLGSSSAKEKAAVIKELPRLLPSGQREKCNDLLKAKLGAKVKEAPNKCYNCTTMHGCIWNYAKT